MKTYISILRGINVGSHKRIKMDSLRKIYEGLGFKNIQIYIQSGNLIFQDYEQQLPQLENRIEQQIQLEFGFEVPVLLIDPMSLQYIIQNNPYRAEPNLSLLHVTLLSAVPEQISWDKIKPEDHYPDQYHRDNQFIYLYCSKGYGSTKLTNNFFENKLRVKASTRNWKTILQLYQMVEPLDF